MATVEDRVTELARSTAVVFVSIAICVAPSNTAAQTLSPGVESAGPEVRPGWSVHRQLLTRRGGSATILSTPGLRHDGTSRAVLEIACHEGLNLEVSLASSDSLATSEPRAHAPVWIRRDGGDRREVDGLLLDPRRVALDASTSREVLDRIVAGADTVELLVFREPHRPYRAVFPLGPTPPGVSMTDFCVEPDPLRSL